MIIDETENCIREDTRNPRRSRRGRGQKYNSIDVSKTSTVYAKQIGVGHSEAVFKQNSVYYLRRKKDNKQITLLKDEVEDYVLWGSKEFLKECKNTKFD